MLEPVALFDNAHAQQILERGGRGWEIVHTHDSAERTKKIEIAMTMAIASPSSTLQELIPFEISSSDIEGLEDEDCRGSGSYGAVYTVTVRGTPRIAKRLHSTSMFDGMER